MSHKKVLTIIESISRNQSTNSPDERLRDEAFLASCENCWRKEASEAVEKDIKKDWE